MQIGSTLNSNKETYSKLIKESIHLNEIGYSIKSRRYPIVIKQLGFKAKKRSYEEEKKNKLPILKLADDTFKTLPSLRNSSYQTYNQSSNILKDYLNKPDLIYGKVMWAPETVMHTTNMFDVERPKRTQIIYAENMFSPNKSSFKQRASVEKVKNSFEDVFDKIKKRSEQRVVDQVKSMRVTF